jgi:hypothetical protein
MSTDSKFLKGFSIAWPFRLISYLLLNPWRNIDVILIIGTGRTGTKFLAKLFANLYGNGVLSLHEPSPDLMNIAVRYFRKRQSSARVVYNIFRAREQFATQCRRNGTTKYIESNNNISYLLPFLKWVFPRLKLIYLTRSPWEFLISEMNKKHGGGYLIFDENDPRVRVTPLINKDKHAGDWNSWSRPKKIAWHWANCNEFILSRIHSFDSLTIKYEDLFDPSQCVRTFNQILSFIGFEHRNDVLQLFGQKSNESARELFTDISQLSYDDASFIKDMTGPVSTKLNY